VTSTAGRVPAPDPGWAFFLDVDGTLAELAPSPAEAHVADALRHAVTALHAATGGALALVSGRPIADGDAMIGTACLPVAGLHGLERRDAGGVVRRDTSSAEPMHRARRRIASLVERHGGLLLEDKGLTLALHYRAAPALASFAHRTMREIQAEAGAGYCIQHGKRVVELRPAGRDKGTAVSDFMGEAPFRGRLPVYVGDDATDEHAFQVVNAMGGHSIKVGAGASEARWRLPDVAAVLAWLARVTR
jgi:trehalose 6-phosphate phosphatase